MMDLATFSQASMVSKVDSDSNDSGTQMEPISSKISVTIYNPKEKIKAMGGAEITIKEFLDYIKTAYQVQDSLEGVLLENGMPEAVDWIRLKESELVKPKNIACQTSATSIRSEDRKDIGRRRSETSGDSDPLKQKLSEVLNEGLLDSVLPFIVPSGKKSSGNLSKDKLSVGSSQSNERMDKKKPSECSSMSTIPVPVSSEVEIHVCDEEKDLKKSFFCNQKLLVEQMGYFAEVTMGQKLEDMDISVHCDMGIFEWLMRWVKREQLLEEDRPQLNEQCAIQVLVSAAFLQMEPLVNECLFYCHEHMNEILKVNTTLPGLNDNVLSRLAAMYTNTEVEAIRDRKDKIQSKLFCKLIMSLCEPEPESVRGHYSSLARIFKCLKCQQLISPSLSETIPCIPSCMRLLPDGSIISRHIRDPDWNITEHVALLHKALKSWRKVYWRLWGDAHFLYCTTCKKHFPAKQIGWCRYHPDLPQYFTMDAHRAPLPIGRYPCCGDRAYRFQPIDDRSGCQFREHTTCTKSVKDASVLAMLESYTGLVAEEPPQLIFPERLTRLVARDAGDDDGKLESKETLWWDGLELVPPRPKLGLLGVLANMSPDLSPAESEDDAADSEQDILETLSEMSSGSSSFSSIGSEECNLSPRKVPMRNKPKGKKKDCHLWQNNLSARSNQDIQRAYEENVVKQMTHILSRRTRSSSPENAMRSNVQKPWSRHITPPGGVWVRLEGEWKDTYISQLPQKMKNALQQKRPVTVRANRLV